VTDLLVAGHDGTAGRVEHWSDSANPGTWTLVSSVTFPGSDFTGIAVSNGNLYLLDCQSKTVLKSAWSPAIPLVSSAFSVFATQLQASALGKADRKVMNSLDVGDAVGVTGPSLHLFDYTDLSTMKLGVLVQDHPGGPVETEFLYQPFVTPRGVVVHEEGVKDGDCTLRSTSAVGFEVLDAQMKVPGCGVGAFDGGDVTFVEGVAMQNITTSPTQHYVGHQGFKTQCRLERDSLRGSEVDYLGALGFVRKNGFLTMSLPIPSDPAWQGLVLLGQFVVFDSQGFELSEVVGFKIAQAPQ